MPRTKSRGRATGSVRSTPQKEIPAKKMAALDKMQELQLKIQMKINSKKLNNDKILAKFQMQTFALTYILYICFYLARKPFSTIKDSLKDPNELNLTDEKLGQIETAFLITYAAAQFIVGPFGDKYGARKLLIVALLGTSFSCYMMSLAKSFFELRLAWAMNGIFQAAAFPLMVKALSPWYDNEQRAIILGYWTTCQQIGGTVAVSLAGYIAAGGFDRTLLGDAENKTTWRDSFLLPAVVAAIAGIITFFMMVEHPSDVGLRAPKSKTSTSSNASTKKPTNETNSKKLSYIDVARLPYLINVGMAYFCIKLVRYTMLTWSISYLKDFHKYDTTEAANMSTLFDIGGAFGAVACAMIAKSFFNGNRIKAVFVLCAVSGFCTGVYGYLASYGTIVNMIMLFVAGFMIAGPDSVLGGAACSDVCERAGYDTSVLTTATGIANGMGSVGAILAGSGPVWVKNQYGWNGLFVCAGGLAFVGALCLLPLVYNYNENKNSKKNTSQSKSGKIPHKHRRSKSKKRQ